MALLTAPAKAHAALFSCSVTGTTVAFGTFSGGVVNVTGTIKTSCTGVGIGDPYTVALNTGGSGAFAPRRMRSGPSNLNYNLYTTAARSTVWGDGTSGTSTVTATIPLSLGAGSDTLTVFGQVPAQAIPTPGSYSDTITITVTF